ncbi:hypothetical protein Hanom_Chr17g01583391 [Helianthus anomalus]
MLCINVTLYFVRQYGSGCMYALKTLVLGCKYDDIGSGRYCISLSSSSEIYMYLCYFKTLVILCYFETFVISILGFYYIGSNLILFFIYFIFIFR